MNHTGLKLAVAGVLAATIGLTACGAEATPPPGSSDPLVGSTTSASPQQTSPTPSTRTVTVDATKYPAIAFALPGGKFACQVQTIIEDGKTLRSATTCSLPKAGEVRTQLPDSKQFCTSPWTDVQRVSYIDGKVYWSCLSTPESLDPKVNGASERQVGAAKKYGLPTAPSDTFSGQVYVLPTGTTLKHGPFTFISKANELVEVQGETGEPSFQLSEAGLVLEGQETPLKVPLTLEN